MQVSEDEDSLRGESDQGVEETATDQATREVSLQAGRSPHPQPHKSSYSFFD